MICATTIQPRIVVAAAAQNPNEEKLKPMGGNHKDGRGCIPATILEYGIFSIPPIITNLESS
jgi:hypothetical protein